MLEVHTLYRDNRRILAHTVRASKPFRGSTEHGIYYARSENNVLTFFLSAHLVNCSEIESENMVQLASDLRKQYLYRTTAVLCAQCLDLSNLDNPRGTESHLIGHAFSEPAGLITCRGVGG